MIAMLSLKEENRQGERTKKRQKICKRGKRGRAKRTMVKPKQKCEDGNVGAVEVALKTHVYLGETSWSYVATVMKILERLRRGFMEDSWREREKIGRGGGGRGVDSTVGVQKMAISTLIERSLEVFNENRQLATSYA